MNKLLFSALAVLVVTSCKDGSQASPDRAAPPAAPPDAGSGPSAVVVYGRVAVREKADEKSRAVTLLSYGERVSVLEPGDAFTHVKLSDGQTGYAQTKMLLTGDISEGTLTTEQDLYVRPDSRSNTVKRVTAGLYMFGLNDLNGYRQVQLPDRSRGWVPRQKFITEEAELGIAQAMYRAEVLVEARKPADALRVLQEALTAYPNARLAPMLQARITPLLPPDGGAPVMADAGRPVESAPAPAVSTAPPAPAAESTSSAAPAPAPAPAP